MRADRLTILLTYAIAAVGAGAALFHVSPLVAAVLLLAAALGLAWDLRDRHPLSSWALNLVAIAGILAMLALPSPTGTLGRLFAASTVLMAAKLLSPKSNRDRMQIILLSLLLLIGAAVVTLSMSFALLFLLHLILAMCYLVWMPFASQLTGRTAPRSLMRRLAASAGLLLALSLPVLLVIYVGLPRAASPLVPGSALASRATAGFADQIRPGDVSVIALSNEPVFRAVVSPQSAAQLGAPYWRGAVFDLTDGRGWSRSPGSLQILPLLSAKSADGQAAATGSAARIEQTIFLEPTGSTTLFALDRPESLAPGGPRAILLDGAVLESERPPLQRVRYQVLSVTGGVLPVLESAETLAKCLALPADLPPELPALATQIVGNERSDAAKAELILRHFQTSGYHYSLAGKGSAAGQQSSAAEPSATGIHPLASFLETKTGYCEHFASAMALMLRAAGVPSRLIGGYLGGDYNTSGGYYLVTQRSAHAWVEAYLEGRGWVRYDPTPPGEGPAAAPAAQISGFSRLVDSLRLRWYSLVIGYDMDRQLNLFRSLSGWIGGRLSWRPSGAQIAVVAGVLGCAGLALAAWLVTKAARGRRSIERLYASLLRRLARRGLRRGPAEGPLDFASRVAREAPSAAEVTADVTEAYVSWRYGGGEAEPQQTPQLRRRVNRLGLRRPNG